MTWQAKSVVRNDPGGDLGRRGRREQRPDHVEINPQGAGSWSSSGLREDSSLEPGATEETVGRRPDWQVEVQGTQELGAELPQGDRVTLPTGQLQLWKSFLPCENAALASPGSWEVGLPSYFFHESFPHPHGEMRTEHKSTEI